MLCMIIPYFYRMKLNTSSGLKSAFFTLCTAVLLFVCSACERSHLYSQQMRYVDYVSPFIGTDAHGHTYPGAAYPHGLVQLSPDTRLDGWDGCSGYHYTDSIIYGFSHTHLSGTGVSDYGDILVMPFNGEVNIADYGYQSTFYKENEEATPGYYKVLLNDYNIQAELTVGSHTGYHRYTSLDNKPMSIVVDLDHRDMVLSSSLLQVDGRSLSGHRQSKAWAEDQHIYFYMTFSHDIGQIEYFIDDNPVNIEGDTILRTGLKAIVTFTNRGESEPLLVNVGLSAVDQEGARYNLTNEVPSLSFEDVKKRSKDTWNQHLGRIEVETENEEHLIIFYTALYHCFIAPNVWSDLDGRYRGMDGKIYDIDQRVRQYTIFSLWDTYRALHPLMSIIDEKRTLEFIHSFLRHYEQGGLLPVWELAANETFCMIGYHSVPVIVDAWMKGIRDFDADLALEAMIHSANQTHHGLDIYRERGYIGSDHDHESVSKTLEYAYDDWCIAIFAKDIGREDVYEEFIQRAQYYKNLFDPGTSLFRPRYNGGWKTPFDPTEVDFNFTEANAWQYGFYVPQDINTLIDLHGGPSAFDAKLDELFETELGLSGRHQVDITGLIGQYAHGNEPSHHMAYLYNYINRPDKTQKRVHQILEEQYSVLPDGLSGNEDCGQMSAWYVMSALGFYPVTPGSNIYAIGYPLFDKATIHLENGQSFTISAQGRSRKNSAIAQARLNDTDIGSYINHEDIVKGGELSFIFSNKEDKSSVFYANAPISIIEDFPIAVNPVIEPVLPVFKDKVTLHISTLFDEDTVYYSLNDGQWVLYRDSLVIYGDTEVKAKTINRNGIESFEVVASYNRLSNNYTVELLSDPHPQYAGEGPDDLVNGLRGAKNWRLGNWIGFYDQDFEAIVDLKEVKTFNTISAGFAQDIKSWIWLPREVTFLVSEDGDAFKTIKTIATAVPDDEYGYISSQYTITQPMKGRYIKVKAKNYGEIPEWHLGHGNSSYIFIDEIIIE